MTNCNIWIFEDKWIFAFPCDNTLSCKEEQFSLIKKSETGSTLKKKIHWVNTFLIPLNYTKKDQASNFPSRV